MLVHQLWHTHPPRAEAGSAQHASLLACSLHTKHQLGSAFELLVPLIIFVGLTATPSVNWTGALTPVVTHITAHRTISVPSYDNASLVHEWPSELDSQGPSLRNKKGFFYSVGVQTRQPSRFGFVGHACRRRCSSASEAGQIAVHLRWTFLWHWRICWPRG